MYIIKIFNVYQYYTERVYLYVFFLSLEIHWLTKFYAPLTITNLIRHSPSRLCGYTTIRFDDSFLMFLFDSSSVWHTRAFNGSELIRVYARQFREMRRMSLSRSVSAH